MDEPLSQVVAFEEPQTDIRGWVLGWAITTAAVAATGGTAGWQQSPPWSLPLGMALGALGLFVGSWVADRERFSAPELKARRWMASLGWALAFVAGLSLLLAASSGLLSLILGAGLIGLAGGAASAALGRASWLRGGALWGTAFAIGFIANVFLGYLLGGVADALAGDAGFMLGIALSGALGGALAGGVAWMLDG
ncbi:MAG TPA: hypothetical protein VF756_04390 [Thermoanaerobaculia bacterium]